ncbi:TMV resistance protein N-like [Quercus robur]|uniref:TMV resistance protein N-like n=1 Tax=Quercus robur TaxID=38942 RepID=UPI002161C490|nr:TMV resistance protein N-like [Quercus robur]
MEMKKLTVLPVFHYVDPSDVRNQTGTFAEAFAKHEERFKETIADVEKWRVALTKVANAAGWDLRDQYQAKVIEKIVGEILGKLNSTSSIVPSDLVGINSRMEKLENLLDMGLKDTLLMGIWGMGGMGKTTLVEVVHGRFLNHFEGNSFLANVREQGRGPGLVSLQKKLLSDILIGRSIDFSNVRWGREEIRKRLSHKKVLIILDDVDHPKQLEALVGDKNWFGPGSRIIITTRDQQLLINLGVDKIYQTEELNNNEALKLFSRKAFKNDSPLEGYEELSQEFIYYDKGVPLALEVVGSSLPLRNVDQWKSTLAGIKKNPPSDILEALKISFDGLEESEKNLFLDIACFFNREYYKTNILQALHDQLDKDIDILFKKSLITISCGYLQMHDLLQDLGRKIVCRESIEAGRRSRVWCIKDVFHVLKENTGTDLVTGIFLNAPPKNKEHLNAKAFSNMKNLRLLKISNVHLPQGLNYLSSKLRYIHWDGYTSESLPTIFEPKELVELIMPCSLMKRLWKGIKSSDELKLIDLSDSKNLIETPDFSGVPNLEQLILQRCTTLSRIHKSLWNLKRLIRLDLNGCKCLESLPDQINMESLEVFILSGCSRLKNFPKSVENMSHLSKLDLSETPIKHLPAFVKHLTVLINLDLSKCRNLSSLPDASCHLTYLKSLNLSFCSKVDKLPESLGNIKGLEELNVSCTAIRELPSSIGLLEKLKVLILWGCVGLSYSESLNKLLHTLSGLCSLTELVLGYCNLSVIPDVIGCLSSLEVLNLAANNFVCIPESIIQLTNLDILYLFDCTDLQSLPWLPLNIRGINLDGCISLETIPIGPEYDFLKLLYLVNCFKIKEELYYDMISMMLRRDLIKDPCIPGRRTFLVNIPEWFIEQNEEASEYTQLHVKLDDNWNQEGSVSLTMYSDECNKIAGIFMRASFRFNQHHPPDEYGVRGCKLRWVIEVNKEYFEELQIFPKFFSEYNVPGPYHLWMEYVPCPHFNGDLKKALSKGDADGISEIIFFLNTTSPGLEVWNCAAYLVYEHDIEQLKQIQAESQTRPYQKKKSLSLDNS